MFCSYKLNNNLTHKTKTRFYDRETDSIFFCHKTRRSRIHVYDSTKKLHCPKTRFTNSLLRFAVDGEFLCGCSTIVCCQNNFTVMTEVLCIASDII